MTKESRIGLISSFGTASREDNEWYWKRILVVDDDSDIITTFKFGIENATKIGNKRIVVDGYVVPKIALLDFQPNLYEFLLIDINMS